MPPSFDLVIYFRASSLDNFLHSRLQQYGELHIDGVVDCDAAQTYIRRAVRHVCDKERRYIRPERTAIHIGHLRPDAVTYDDMHSLYGVSGAPERMLETAAIEPMLSDAAWASLVAQAAAARIPPQQRPCVVVRVGVMHRTRTFE